MLKIDYRNSVTYGGKNYASLVTFLAARRILGANRFKFKDSNQSLSSGINSAYTHTGNILDALVASELNARYVTGTAGRGVIFDNIIINDDKTFSVSENKLVSSVVDASGIVERVSKISVAGGEGINLSEGTRKFFTGEDFDVTAITLGNGDKSPVDISNAKGVVEVSISKYFISELLKNKNNQDKLKALIGGNSKAAEAIRKNFEFKSSAINVVLDINGRPAIRTIGWSWKDIVSNPKARISVKPDGAGGVNFNIYFTPAAVKDALNKAKTIYIAEDKGISDALAKSLNDQLAAFSPEVIDFLNTYSVQIKHSYSTDLYSGNIKDTSKIKVEASNESTGQKFISNAQWTVLVQRRLGDTMLSFGDPEPPDLKERSGRFRRSVDIQANYRTKTLQYTYNPLYRSLEHYGYHPEQQIERSIRQVAQELYTQNFNILRRGGLA